MLSGSAEENLLVTGVHVVTTRHSVSGCVVCNKRSFTKHEELSTASGRPGQHLLVCPDLTQGGKAALL